MRRKIFLAIAVLASCLLPLASSYAQNITTVSATIVDPNGLPYSNASIQAQLLPTGITPTVPPPCNGQNATPCVVAPFSRTTADVTGAFSMNLASNVALSPGGTQWQFTVNEAPGIAPPAGSGPQQCTPVAITISGASQNLSSTINLGCPKLSNFVSPGTLGSGAALGPIINVTIPSALCPGCNAKGTTQTAINGSIASGSANFVDTTDAPFKASDVGSQVWVIYSGNGGGYSEKGGGLGGTANNFGTITSFTDSGHITLSFTAFDGNCTAGNCQITWGPDDDPAIQAGLASCKGNAPATGNNVAPYANTLFFPPGGFNFHTLISTNTGAGTICNVWGSGNRSSTLYPRPDFTSSGQCLFANFGTAAGGTAARDIGIDGSLVVYNANQFGLCLGGSNSQSQNILVTRFGNEAVNSAGIGFGGTHARYTNITGVTASNNSSDVMPWCLLDSTLIATSDIDFYGLVCSNPTTAPSIIVRNVTNDKGGSRISFFGGLFDECGLTTATGCSQLNNVDDVTLNGTTVLSQGNNTTMPMWVTGNATVRLNGVDVGPFCGGACTQGGGVRIDSGSTVIATMSKFRNYGSGIAITGPGTFQSNGGNKYFGTGGLGNGFTTAGSPVFIENGTHSTYNCTIPVLTATTTAATTNCIFTVDQQIQINRFQIAFAPGTLPVTCSPAPTLQITNGTTTQNLATVNATAQNDSGVITSSPYAAATKIAVIVQTAAAGCGTTPTNAQINIEWQNFGPD